MNVIKALQYRFMFFGSLEDDMKEFQHSILRYNKTEDIAFFWSGERQGNGEPVSFAKKGNTG